MREATWQIFAAYNFTMQLRIENCQILQRHRVSRRDGTAQSKKWHTQKERDKKKVLRKSVKNCLPRQLFLTSSRFSSLVPERTRWAPTFASSYAMPSPIPLDAPVIHTTFPFKVPASCTQKLASGCDSSHTTFWSAPYTEMRHDSWQQNLADKSQRTVPTASLVSKNVSNEQVKCAH